MLFFDFLDVLNNLFFYILLYVRLGSGAANVFASRYVEIANGISVVDEEGNKLGVSKQV